MGGYGAVREQGCGRLWCGAGTGLPKEGSGPPGRGNLRKRRGQRGRHDGRWPQNAVNKTNNYQTTVDTKEKNRNMYNIFGLPGPGMLYRLPSLDVTVRWRVALCCVVCGSDRTGNSNSTLLNHVRC